MRYALIAEINNVYQHKKGWAFEDHWSDEVVALFDDKDNAYAYIEKARLEKPIVKQFSSIKNFKQNSLLKDATYASVVMYDNPNLPLNPTL